MSNHADRFFAAVSVLVEHGPIKQRLIRAYESHLADIDRQAVPEVVASAFGELHGAMHSVNPHNGEGPICASVRKMSKIEADRCARMIVNMARDVLRDDQAIVPPEDADIPLEPVPPFLVKSAS